MKALVLAAGVGNRLRPYTDTVPKPMLQIGPSPILAYNLAMLARAGFDDITLNLHYLPDVVRDYVGDGSKWNVRVGYSEEAELLGTAGALVPIAAQLRDGTFAIVFGDNLVEADLTDAIAFHRARGGVATILVWHRDDTSQSGVAELDANDRIVRFIEKPQPGETHSHWVNAGVIIAEPELLDAVPPLGPSDLGRDVLPALLASGLPIYAYRMSGGLWWFDRVADYEAALADPRLTEFTARMAL